MQHGNGIEAEKGEKLSPRSVVQKVLLLCVFGFSGVILLLGTVGSVVFSDYDVDFHGSSGNGMFILAYFVLIILAGFGVFFLYRFLRKRELEKWTIAAILFIAMISRCCFVYFVPVEQLSDFSVYYKIGVVLASGDLGSTHSLIQQFGLGSIGGLAVINSLLVLIFGSNMSGFLIGQVFVQVLIVFLIYLIGSLFNRTIGIVASFLYSVYLGSIVSVLITTNQHLATLFFLLAVFLVLSWYVRKRYTFIPTLALWGGAAVSLAVSYYCHPSTTPLILAIVLWGVLLIIAVPKKVKYCLCGALFLLAVYAGSLSVFDLGMKSSGLVDSSENGSMLGKIAVGLEIESNGVLTCPFMGYNNEYEYFNSLGKEKAEEYLSGRVRDSLSDPRVLSLFVDKERTLWNRYDTMFLWAARQHLTTYGVDSLGVGYESFSSDDKCGPVLFSAMQIDYWYLLGINILCGAFLIFSAIKALREKVRKGKLSKKYISWAFLALLLDAWVAVFLLIEVQARYRYELMPLVFLFAAAALALLANAYKERQNEKRNPNNAKHSRDVASEAIKDKAVSIRKNSSVAGEWLVVSLFLAVFTLAAVISPVSNHDNTLSMCAWVACCGALLFVALFQAFKSYSWAQVRISSAWKFPLFIGAITLLVRVPFMTDAPLYWDSGFFYYYADNAVHAFDFSLESFFDSFKLADHAAYGYASSLAIGLFLDPYSVVGVNLVNALIESTAVLMLTKVCIGLFPKKPQWLVALFSGLIGFTPLLYGTFGSINLDMPMACFLIIATCLAAERRYVLMGFFFLLAVGSKEPGIVFFAAYAIVLVVRVSFRAKAGKRLSSLTSSREICALGFTLLALVCFVLLTIFYQGQGFIWGGTSGLVTPDDIAGGSHFGFDWNYILSVLKASFLLNFNWVFSLVILAGIVFELFRKKWDRGVIGLALKSNELFCFVFGVGAILLFSALYITHTNPRYLMLIHLELVLFAVLFILANTNSRSVSLCLLSLFYALCLVSSFITVDPVTKSCFLNIGEPDGSQVTCSNLRLSTLPDACIYNRQMMVYGDAVNQILKETDYDGTFCYVMNPRQPAMNTYYSFAGWDNGGEGLFVWDRDNQTRVIDSPQNNGYEIRSENIEEWKATQSDSSRDKKVIYITSALFDLGSDELIDDGLELLSGDYVLGNTGTAGYGAFRLNYYEFSLREN